MAHYSKTYTSPAQLTALLQSRGLHVENVTRTENYLRHIGYYKQPIESNTTTDDGTEIREKQY